MRFTFFLSQHYGVVEDQLAVEQDLYPVLPRFGELQVVHLRYERVLAVDVSQLERLIVGLEDGDLVFRVDDARPLPVGTLALAPPVDDKERRMDRGELGRPYRLEEAYQHELTVILTLHIVTEYR